MFRGKALVIAAFLLIPQLSAFVQIGDSPIDGTWAGKIPLARAESLEVTFVFKTEGELLRGVVRVKGGEFPLADGKVKGNQLSFRVEGEKPQYAGHISGDKIEMTMTMFRDNGSTPETKFTLERVKG